MLKEADPTGEGFIMMSDGGVPKWFEGKPGYYDGAYSYIDVDGRMVKSTKENKVDVICKEKEWVIWDELDWLLRQEMAVFVEKEESYHFDHDHWFDCAKSLFIFDGTVPETYKDKFYESIKSDFNYWVTHKEKEDKKWMDQTLKEHSNGIRFFERKTTEKYRESFQVNVDGKQENLRCGTIQALYYSGAFKRIDHDEKLWEWIPKMQ